jgi:hypothetical protein
MNLSVDSLMEKRTGPPVDGGSIPTSTLQQLRVERCELRHIRYFIKKHHYSGTTNGVTGSFYFRVLLDQRTVGAAIFGRPAGLGVADAYAAGGALLELRRFCLLEKLPKNSESRVLGIMLRMLAKAKVDSVLSYADPAHNHEGTIYKACGFKYLGRTGRQTNIIWNGKKYPRRNLGQTSRPFHVALNQAVQSGEAQITHSPGKHIFLKKLKG